MGHLAVWKVLEQTIAEFRKKGLDIPIEVMNDLKSARIMIKILKADPSCSEAIQKIEEYLGNVESYLVMEGQRKFGVEYIEEMLRRLDEAGERINDEEEEKRFVPGIPREAKWIRVKPFKEFSIERLKEIARELNLSCNVQDDGCLLVYGKSEQIKDFVKKMTAKH